MDDATSDNARKEYRELWGEAKAYQEGLTLKEFNTLCRSVLNGESPWDWVEAARVILDEYHEDALRNGEV